MRDDPTIAALLARSNRSGADKRVTNFAGGNTSAKVTLADPITGAPTRVLAVKGSGGDLGTMTVAGLAFLDLDRVRALETVHASGSTRTTSSPTTSTAGSATVARCRRSTPRCTPSSPRTTSTTCIPTR